MANTTNFGWETPDDTDLVKDGAAAMRTLGGAIDTSLVDLKGGTTDQVLAKNSNTDMDFKWVTSDDANAIQNAIVDAKGDLISASAADTPARLAVGNNGETLVADDSATTGLRWQGNFAAGKNKIINGDFAINQRNFTSTSSSTYGFDRWTVNFSGATGTYSAQTFTLGAAPVAGYEAKNFARLDVTTGNDNCRLIQGIESVRTLAGQTVTVSFWAKGTNPTTAGNLKVQLEQYFGTGGSPSSTVFVTAQNFVLTANWTRYSLTFALPSISGKTIGTNNNDAVYLTIGQGASVSTDAWTLDIWGVQVEAGSVATAFQTATGTLAGELDACRRYYQECQFTNGVAISTTSAQIWIQHNGMRVAPSAVASAALKLTDASTSDFTQSSAGISIVANNADAGRYDVGSLSGMTTNRVANLINGGGKVQLSAEL